MGRDYEAECIDYKTSKFQPTRPYGARPAFVLDAVRRHQGFNPRAPMGRDGVRLELPG